MSKNFEKKVQNISGFNTKQFIEQYNNNTSDYTNYPNPVNKLKGLIFNLNNKKVQVYGGSCHHPNIDTADVYVSLDVQQPVYYWEQPWANIENKQHIRFPIEDMFIPEDSQEFKSCIQYLQSCLTQDKTMHVGCIGGHGRTGMVLSALVQSSMGNELIDKDGNKISAIDYVREHYAIQAVETVPQILFLHYNFNIDFPKNSEKELQEFFTIFKQEVGINLPEILQKGVHFDELFEIIKLVDNQMYAQSQLQSQKTNNSKTEKKKM